MLQMGYSLPSMGRRQRSNPLALAILCVLQEGPRHPYDVAATLKQRKKHESIKLNYGSLYNVVEQLERDGFVEVVEVVRHGRRPERTVYGITEAGLREMTDWLAELVSSPQDEWPQFEAALSLLPALPPDDVVELLDHRLVELDLAVARHRSEQRLLHDELGLPRLFALEGEYAAAVLAAERAFVAALRADIAGGTLDGIDHWRAWHAAERGAAWPSPLPLAAGDEPAATEPSTS